MYIFFNPNIIYSQINLSLRSCCDVKNTWIDGWHSKQLHASVGKTSIPGIK